MPDSESTIEVILPEPLRKAGAARRLRDSFEPIAMHNIAHEATLERAGAHGLDRLAGYVWGRAAPMGEPTAAVVVAAFGVFEPELIAAAYERGRKGVGRQALLTAQVDATATSLRSVLGDIDVSAAVTALRRGIEAAHGTGRALFSGLLRCHGPRTRRHSSGVRATCCESTGAIATSRHQSARAWIRWR